MINKYLEDLEQRIDSQTEKRIWNVWEDFCNGKNTQKIFVPQRSPVKSKVEWPKIGINQAIDSYELMLIHQLKDCSDILENGAGAVLNVRCNYGTGIIPSLFDAEPFIMDDELDTLPTTKPIIDKDEINRIIERGVPDINKALGGKVFEMAEFFKEKFEKHPNVKNHIHIYHPDIQGPMDVCELVYGSDMFLTLIENPAIIIDLLELFTETYITFFRKWEEIVPYKTPVTPHWGYMHKGKIMIRDDSAMNLSPEMFDEFIKPYDQRLLNELGGGAIHFCGKGDHYIETMCTMDKLYAIHMSQPQYNDLETIFINTIDKGINLLGYDKEQVTTLLESGRDLKGRVHKQW